MVVFFPHMLGLMGFNRIYLAVDFPLSGNFTP